MNTNAYSTSRSGSASKVHTPAPWRIKTSDNIFGDDRALMVMKGRRTIAEVMLIDQPQSQRDNARLIATAPELLEAAQAALNCIGALPPTLAHLEVAQMLTAVIAKATGSEA